MLKAEGPNMAGAGLRRLVRGDALKRKERLFRADVT
jgi:hypothetical protein